jgi:hypothetical protein
MKIGTNECVMRQTATSEYSHFDGSWEELEALTLSAFGANRIKPGYRDGVVLVEVDPERFYTSVVELEDGDIFRGEFKRRVVGEEPRKSVYVVRPNGKQKACAVDIVLYRKDVLAENNENSTDADWEIVSINARPTNEEMPMSPSTLMANHFQVSGGTATKMTNDEFVAELERCFRYWRNKSHARQN